MRPEESFDGSRRHLREGRSIGVCAGSVDGATTTTVFTFCGTDSQLFVQRKRECC
jgi:hypothetical protein